MPANYNRTTLKNQIKAKAAQLDDLLVEAGCPQPGQPFTTSRELDAARLAVDESVAHAVNHVDRNWPAPTPV